MTCRPRERAAVRGVTPVPARVRRGIDLRSPMRSQIPTPRALNPPPPPACRAGCAACCIAPSISSPIPGMPGSKAAGMACVQLEADLRCRLFGDARRPRVCTSLGPSASMCGDDREAALADLAALESATIPHP